MKTSSSETGWTWMLRTSADSARAASIAIGTRSRAELHWTVTLSWPSTRSRWVTSPRRPSWASRARIGPFGRADLDPDDLGAAQAALQPLGRVERHDAPVVDDRDPVAELVGLLHVVRGEEHGPAVVAQLEDALAEVARRLRVEAHRRLVEEQQRGVGEECAGQHEALPHAGAELLDVVVGAVRQVDRLEDVGMRVRAWSGRRW
jgi:hypothetical protein